MANRHVRQAKQDVNFRLRAGTRISGISADVAAAELQRIYLSSGELRPRQVVDESREEAAPLHPVFEWDDRTAAEEYRTYQARDLIRSVQVIGENSDPTPVYVHVGQSGYHPVSVVVSQPSMYEQALKELNARAKALKDAAASLQSAAFDIDDERAPIIQTAITAVDQASAAIAALR